VIASRISRVSAVVFALSGLALLFAPDIILPHLVLGYLPSGLWLAQLLVAACRSTSSAPGREELEAVMWSRHPKPRPIPDKWD